MGSGASGIYEGAFEYRCNVEGQRASAMGGASPKEGVVQANDVRVANPSGLERNAAAVKDKFRLHEDGYFCRQGEQGA